MLHHISYLLYHTYGCIDDIVYANALLIHIISLALFAEQGMYWMVLSFFVRRNGRFDRSFACQKRNYIYIYNYRRWNINLLHSAISLILQEKLSVTIRITQLYMNILANLVVVKCFYSTCKFVLFSRYFEISCSPAPYKQLLM